MSLVRAIFDSIDLAELASLRLKTELKTVRHVDLASEPYPTQSAESRLADYFNTPVAYNGYEPYSMGLSTEAELRTATRVTVQLDRTEVKACLSLLRSMGGTKVLAQSD